MVLSYYDLKDNVQNTVMTPVPDTHVEASSIILTLGPRLLVERKPPELGEGQYAVVSLRDREALDFDTVDLPGQDDPDGWLLYPGTFALAESAERFYMPPDLSADFRMSSTAGRTALIHGVATWCASGWSGSVLTLELHNASTHHVVALRSGDRIGSMVFHRHANVPASRAYRGAYNGNLTVSAARPEAVTVNAAPEPAPAPAPAPAPSGKRRK